MEDARIVELYLNREEEAIVQTSLKYGARLRALAGGIARDPHTAQECENDAYLEAWRSIPPHAPRDYLYAFLARITRHIALNRCRERARLRRSAHIAQLSREMEECIPAPEDVECRMDAQELARALNGFLATLSQQKRNLFLRRYWYLDSMEEIAARSELSQGNVRVTLHRIRAALRDYLIREGYEL